MTENPGQGLVACPSCGAQVFLGSVFCPSCGLTLPVAPPASLPAAAMPSIYAPQVDAPLPAPAPAQSNRKTIGLTIGGIAVAVILVAATLLAVRATGGPGRRSYVYGGTFKATATMSVARVSQTSTLLPDGRVLIAGGSTLKPAELYDPKTGKFSTTGSLITERWWHTATLLPDGQVLIAGGNNGNPLTGAELYNPKTGAFSQTGFMIAARGYHTATLLRDGRVLVAGGFDD